MARFFFHLFDDLETRDEEGADFPHLEAAIKSAICSARRLAAEQMIQGRLHLGHRIEIADERGTALHSVPFASTFEIVA